MNNIINGTNMKAKKNYIAPQICCQSLSGLLLWVENVGSPTTGTGMPNPSPRRRTKVF